MKSYPVHVLDLTTRLGVHALEQLGLPGVADSGYWPAVRSSRLPAIYSVNWQRARAGETLQPPPDGVVALAVIIGPGALSQLDELKALLSKHSSLPTWVFLAPSAIVEEGVLRSLHAATKPAWALFRLPDSDPKTLWFVLLEQMVAVVEAARLADPDQHLETERLNVSSNLKQSIDQAMTIDGALAAALVDYRSGMCLAQAGSGLNLDLAAAGNTQVVRAKLQTVESLGLRRGIEDILITLVDQYHLIRLVPNTQGLFLYLVLDKVKGNLALARYKLTEIERTLKV